jgi:hypothetical protein
MVFGRFVGVKVRLLSVSVRDKRLMGGVRIVFFVVMPGRETMMDRRLLVMRRRAQVVFRAAYMSCHHCLAEGRIAQECEGPPPFI